MEPSCNQPIGVATFINESNESNERFTRHTKSGTDTDTDTHTDGHSDLEQC